MWGRRGAVRARWWGLSQAPARPAALVRHAPGSGPLGAGTLRLPFLALGVAVATMVGGVLPAFQGSEAAAASGGGTYVTEPVCPAPTPGHVTCMLEIRGRRSRTTNAAVRDGAARESTIAPLTSLSSNLLTPRDITKAYGFTKSDVGTGTGETIAVVDAYYDRTVATDLSDFSSHFGLPACTSSNGCFKQEVYEHDGDLPQGVTTDWAMETSLDVEWVHAMAPKAHVLLVEAYTTTMVTMLTAVTYAASNASYVSMSWGGSESAGETSVRVFAAHDSTVSFFASSGDTGSEVIYPAASPAVISVGGTRLTVTLSTGAFESESAWSSGGGGCSEYEEANPAQAAFSTYDQTGASCAGKRAIPDVAADATPATGVAVYVSSPSGTGWWQVGGTSVAAPLWAGHAAEAGLHVTATLIYASNTVPFHDITTGSNGHTCVTGYNLCDGLGSWNSNVSAPYVAPLRPTPPRAAAGDGEAVVSWSAPTSGNAEITSFSVTSSPSGGGCTWTTGPLSCTVTGLTNGTPYTFSVTATNALGSSPVSQPSAAVTPEAPLTAPVGVGAVAHSTGVSLQWTAVATATGYDVFAGTTPGGETYSTPVAGCADVQASDCSASGLDANTTYYFSVKSLHDAVPSTAGSSEIAATTVPPPAGVQASTATGSVSLTWSPVSGVAAVAYSVYGASAPGAETYAAALSTCTSLTTTSCTLSAATGGSATYFTVEAAGTETTGVAFTTTPSAQVSTGVDVGGGAGSGGGGGSGTGGGGGGGGASGGGGGGGASGGGGGGGGGGASGGGGGGGGGGGASGGGGSGGSSTGSPKAPAPPSGATSDHTCSVASGSCHVSNDGVTLTTSSGSGALTVSQYSSNPEGTPSFSSANEYFDVDLASGSSFASATVKDCNLNGGTALYWWSSGASRWETVSPISAAPGTARCLTATLSSLSSPTLSQLTGTVFAVGAPSSNATRISGKTADATAAQELAHQFTPTVGDCPGSGAVVLSRDNYYSDALASQYLAASLTTGTLLTPTGSLSAVTRSAIEEEGISHVYIVGGSLAVSTSVEDAIEALPVYDCGGKSEVGGTVQVTRIDGATEFATAQMAATMVRSSFVGHADVASAYGGTNAMGGAGRFNATAGKASTQAPAGTRATAILATGESFQDAESASVMSYDEHFPILLTAPTVLSPPTATAIKTLGITQVIVMGGQDAISDAVVAQLEALGVSVLRVAGIDATDTAVEAADFEMSAAGLHWAPVSGVVVARGDFYSDGLAGAVVAAGAGRSSAHDPEPLLLTEDPSTLGPYLQDFLERSGLAAGIATDDEAVTSLTVLGGTAAVTPATVSTMEGSLRA